VQDLPFIKRVVEMYVRYSIARNLRRYMRPKAATQDPELDLEAEASKTSVGEAKSDTAQKARMKSISKFLCCELVEECH